MATSATPAERAAEETIKASREAKAYFQSFDSANLYHAAAQRSTGWLLGEKSTESETLPRYAPMAGFSLPSREDTETTDNNTYALFVPKEADAPLHLQELNRVVWELVVGIYVFNQVPTLSLQPNHDGSSACSIPSAYHDTLVGSALFEVDYFVKSLLHGTYILRQEKREKINDAWKKLASERNRRGTSLRQSLKDMGMVYLIDDPELGVDVYESKKLPFIRHPPKFVNSDLGHSELTPRLTTGEEFDQQEAHLSRDVFLSYLDQVAISLVFTQNSIKQKGSVFVLDTDFEVTSRVLPSSSEQTDSSLYWHLHTYLQKQHNFVVENICRKKNIHHFLALLRFASFMTQFLVTLKQHKRIISLKSLRGVKSGDVLCTSREVSPVLPSETSQWSPFTNQDSYTSLHGEIAFHLPQLPTEHPSTEFLDTYETLRSTGEFLTSDELQSCTVSDKDYYIFPITTEIFYTKSPKLPRWVHAMISELKAQCAHTPSLNPRIPELLKKPYNPRQVATMQTMPAQLLASVRKGILPVVTLLLKRCTKTHLNKLDDQGKALVHYAAMNGQADVLSALFHAGCVIDQCCMTADQKPTATRPLHLATRSGVLDAVCCLIHFGADVLSTDDSGWTAVHYAAFHNYKSIVRHICAVEKKCIELKTSDRAKATPLLLAAWSAVPH